MVLSLFRADLYVTSVLGAGWAYPDSAMTRLLRKFIFLEDRRKQKGLF